MPDLRLTIKRLADHFRRMAVTYAAATAAACLIAYLLFDVAQPRVPAENQVKILYCAGTFDTEAFDGLASDVFDALTQGSSHPAVQEVSFECFTYGSPSGDDPSVSVILSARLSAGDADLFIASSAAARFILKTDSWQDWSSYMNDPAAGLSPEGALTVRDEGGGLRVAALSGADLTALRERGCVSGAEDLYVFLSSTTTNAADSIDALKAMLDLPREGGNN